MRSSLLSGLLVLLAGFGLPTLIAAAGSFLAMHVGASAVVERSLVVTLLAVTGVIAATKGTER